MKKNTRWHFAVLLMVMMFISIFPIGVHADSQGDENLPNTDPNISEVNVIDERAGGEKGDPDQPAEAQPAADDEKEVIETSPNPVHDDNYNGEQTEVDVEGQEQTAVCEEARVEEDQEREDAEEIVQEPDEHNDDVDPLMENALDEEPDKPNIPNPIIHLKVSFDGDKLEIGTPVTITAVIDGIPEGMTCMLQWRNNASGEFQDVPGETGMSVIFVADERNVSCSWQLMMKVTVPEAGA